MKEAAQQTLEDVKKQYSDAQVELQWSRRMLGLKVA